MKVFTHPMMMMCSRIPYHDSHAYVKIRHSCRSLRIQTDQLSKNKEPNILTCTPANQPTSPFLRPPWEVYTLTREHLRQARKFRRPFGTVSMEALAMMLNLNQVSKITFIDFSGTKKMGKIDFRYSDWTSDVNQWPKSSASSFGSNRFMELLEWFVN